MLELAEDLEKYWGMAKKWSNQKDWGFASATDKFNCEKGVAEFLANQDGKTLFYSNRGQHYETISNI